MFTHEETKTGIVFYDNDKVIAKYFPKTTDKVRTTQDLTRAQFTYISSIIKTF